MELLIRIPWSPIHVHRDIAVKHQYHFYYNSNPRGYFEEFKKDGLTLFGISLKSLKDAEAETTFPSRESLAGKRRFLFIGDSFTRGQGVRWKDTFPQVFCRLMNDSDENSTLVFNTALPGAAIRDVYIQLRGMYPVFRPGTVIYGYVLNDPVNKAEWDQEYFMPTFSAPDKELREPIFDLINFRSIGKPETSLIRVFKHSAFFRTLFDRYERSLLGKRAIIHYNKLHSQENSYGIHITEHILREMNSACKRAGSDFVVLIFPVFYKLDKDYPLDYAHESVEMICARNKIQCLDLLKLFEGHKTEKLQVHPMDLHPNEIAHKMVAEYLFEHFEESGDRIDGYSYFTQVQ